jgi:hypothetical protein
MAPNAVSTSILLERREEMKWYVLTLFLVVGLVGSVSAQQIDPNLVGVWETHDGPCSPCTLTIQEGGKVSFDQAGSAVEVVFSRGTPNAGIDVLFPLGGKVDLSLNRTGNRLTGYYTNPSRTTLNQMVSFSRK